MLLPLFVNGGLQPGIASKRPSVLLCLRHEMGVEIVGKEDDGGVGPLRRRNKRCQGTDNQRR